jgi:pimeloyl-ACP methyl ester carboxylesterase
MNETDSLLLVLLPGMDGTGRLFGPLKAALSGFDTQVIAYPTDEPLDYDALTRRVDLALPRNRRLVLVAESFSGPIAIRVARHHPSLVGLVLASSFCRCPRPGLKKIPRALLPSAFFPLLATPWSVRRGLLSPESPHSLVAEVIAAVRGVRPVVMAKRLQEVITVDVTDDFNALTVPVLYLAGTRDRLLRPKALKEYLPERDNVHSYFLDAPHLILQTAPVACASLIRKFSAG